MMKMKIFLEISFFLSSRQCWVIIVKLLAKTSINTKSSNSRIFLISVFFQVSKERKIKYLQVNCGIWTLFCYSVYQKEFVNKQQRIVMIENTMLLISKKLILSFAYIFLIYYQFHLLFCPIIARSILIAKFSKPYLSILHSLLDNAHN